MDIKEFLRKNSVFFSKLGFCYNPPRMDENGKPIVFFDDFDHLAKFHRDLTNAGIKLHSSLLFSGWVGVGRYDYELTDQILEALFKDNPDIYYIPRIKLDVPLDWGKDNPEDMCVYFEGPRDAESIRELVNTPRHDILGYESPKGYYTAGAWQDDRPNVGGVISNQSFSSQKWLKDAGETLRRIIAHLENGPYANRIIAYHIAYGVSGETCLWGRFGAKEKFADYGIVNRQRFFDWGMGKYKSLDQLAKAWLQPDLTKENLVLPTPDMRKGKPGNLKHYLRGNPEDKICIDYDLFMSDVNVDALEHFGKIVKTETGKAVGSFYGYMLEVFNSAYTGYLGIERLLNSPYIDFIAAPKTYYRCQVGEPGGCMIPTQSVNRKKQWLDELDIRTHLCMTDDSKKQSETFPETRAVMWREFCKNTVHNSGFWWMDLGGGWFDSPDILNEAGKIENISKKIRSQKGKSISEILLVVDEESIYYTRANSTAHHLFMREFIREATLCGAPIDIYRFKDLEEIDLSQYKLIVFINNFLIENKEWSQIKAKITPQTTMTWFYAPGILNPEFNLDNVKKITGFEIAECENRNMRPEIIPTGNELFGKCSNIKFQDENKLEIPFVKLKEGSDITVLGHYPDGGIAAASRRDEEQRLQVYFSLPLLRTEHFRVLAEQAGCHFYAPENCTVYADNRLIGIFPKVKLNSTLKLKYPTDLVDVIGGEKWHNTLSIPLNMEAKTAKVLIKENNQ